LSRLLAQRALTTLEVRQASAATMQPYYDPYFVAVLWEGRTRCDSLWRSLKGDVVPVLPDCAGHDALRPPLLDGLRAGQRARECEYARAGARGRPQRRHHWATAGDAIGQATIQTPPMRWFRVEIPEGHWDEYRIEVRSATPRLVYSRVIASQGYWKE
jgi:hypothetical protein